jgi:hypothetical protein
VEAAHWRKIAEDLLKIAEAREAEVATMKAAETAAMISLKAKAVRWRPLTAEQREATRVVVPNKANLPVSPVETTASLTAQLAALKEQFARAKAADAAKAAADHEQFAGP